MTPGGQYSSHLVLVTTMSAPLWNHSGVPTPQTDLTPGSQCSPGAKGYYLCYPVTATNTISQSHQTVRQRLWTRWYPVQPLAGHAALGKSYHPLAGECTAEIWESGVIEVKNTHALPSTGSGMEDRKCQSWW